jgi:Tol biopolymer transport system component/tRNA A-37 threonylcarbamoyl transferase component Bud32
VTISRLAAVLADRYRIERELGQGGMATVYLAEDLKHHRQVAIKVLRPDLAAALGPERFMQEIEIAARLQHPHILPVHDSGSAEGFLYYVMPFVAGESLRERLSRQGELPVHEAVRLLSEIADALAHAHSQGVVHRDIKPENVMLSGRHALVMDFGVAKAVSEASGRNRLTTAGVALGTPAYMAPEQASADPHLDHRVDIYALGVVGYELLAGRPPFTGGSPQQVLAAHVMQAPELVSVHRPSLSPALSGVIMKALEKRPADRWQTAEEMVTQLEPLMTPSGGMTPTQTQPVSGVPPAASRRNRILLLAAAVVILGGGAIFLARRGGSTPDLTLTKTSRLTSIPGIEALPAISPDGQFLAYFGRSTGSAKIYLQPTDGGRAVNITEGMAGGQISPDWSPDGRRLLFVSYDSAAASILTMPPTGGDVRRLYNVAQGGSVPRAPKWSPDGARISFELGDSLFTMAADGSGLTLLAHVRDVHSLAWSPDGRWLAGVRGNATFVYGGSSFGNLAASTVFVVPAAGGTPIMVSDSTTLNVSPVWLPNGSAILYVSSGGGGRDIYLQPIGRNRQAEGTARRITTGLDAHTIALSRDGKRLAYSKYARDLNVLMVRLSPSGTVNARSAVPITQGNQAIEVARLSPDGKWLVYDSDLNGNADIFIIPSDGGTPKQLTDDPSDDLAPDWSADGTLISFHSFRTGNRDVFTVGADGSGLAQATTDTLSDWYAVWGPDDNTLVYSRGEGAGQNFFEIRRASRTAAWGPPSQRGPGATSGMTSDRTAYLYGDFGVEESVSGFTRAISVPSGGGTATVLFQAPPWFNAGWMRMGPDGRTLYIHSRDSLGVPAYWAVDLRTKALRKVVTFDSSDTRTVRGVFDTDGHRFYFVVGEHQADIWIATVEGVTP